MKYSLPTLFASVIILSSSACTFALDAKTVTLLPSDKYSPEVLTKFYRCETNGLISFDGKVSTLNTVKYFGTSITINLYNMDKEQAKSLLCNALAVIQEYHYLASNYSTYPHVTNIKTINESPSKTHKIDPQLTALIGSGIDWYQQSNGYFNIALSPVIDLWRNHRFACIKANNDPSHCSIPTPAELNDAAKLTQIEAIQLDKQANTIHLADGMSIDLGGIAKGWMAEKVYDQLKLDGAQQFMINAGGNIRHFGLHPEGRQFVTAIEDPLCKKSDYQLSKCADFDGQYHEIVTGEDLAIVSSGNYLRYFVVNGQQYHHLIDPNTLYPKPNGIATTVVLNDNQIYADIISTMLFLMPIENALDYANKHEFVEAVWYLNENGDKVTSTYFEKFRLK